MDKNNKIFKVFLVLLVSSSIVFVSLSPSLANNTENLEQVIINYFHERSNCVISGSKSINKFYVVNSKLPQFELSDRILKIHNFEGKFGKIVSMNSTPYIKSINISENTAEVSVYELILFDWMWNKDVITSGMGVNHEMIWSNEDGSWKILKDSYDEGPLTGVRSPDYVTTTSLIVNADVKNDSMMSTQQNNVIVTATSYQTYDRYSAARYADYHVNHSFTTPGSDQVDYTKYNPYFKNFDQYGGGDCANYVSQSLHLDFYANSIHYGGTLPYINPGVYNTSSWWYNTNGTGGTQTSDDYCSSTWSYAPDLYTFIINKGWGTQLTNGNSLSIGDLVFYDWRNSGDSPGIDHVTIVTAISSSGLPLVDSHSWDYYHVPWNYGYSTTIRYPVHIKDQVPIN